MQVYVGGQYLCRISVENNNYVIRIDDVEWTHPADPKSCVGVRLNPHVGGEYVLEHDWFVPIKIHK